VPSLEIFVDTSGWANLVDKNQPQHQAAARHDNFLRQQGKKAVTTSYVITELVALLHSPLRLPRTRIVAIVDGKGLQLTPSDEVDPLSLVTLMVLTTPTSSVDL
jgi:predicted nucleic acid-binding protein